MTTMVREIASNHYQDLRRKMSAKNESSGYEALVKVLEETYFSAVKNIRQSEADAWDRVSRLENLLLDLLHYTPDSDLAKIRAAIAEPTGGAV